MKKLLLASVALATLSFGQAFAADAIVEEPIADLPVGFSWTGAYIGVQAGYGWGSSTTYNNPDPNLATASFDTDPDGFLGGVYLGYNYQLSNNVVVGLEADIAATGIDGDGSLPGGATVGTTDVNYEAAARIRLGYAIDRWLPYIAGGVAVADMDHSILIGGVGPSYSETYVGYTIGGGVEYAFTDNLIFRAEYRFSDFGTEDFPAAAGVVANSVDLDSHDVRVGISYKF